MSRTPLRIAAACLVSLGIAGCLGIAVARQPVPSNETECLGNLKQMAVALSMYAQDYDDKLPSMRSEAALQYRILPYVKKREVYTCPATNQAYKTNPALSEKVTADVVKPATAVTFYDASPHTDGQVSVAYLDGHVKRVAKVPALPVKFIVKKVPSHRHK